MRAWSALAVTLALAAACRSTTTPKPTSAAPAPPTPKHVILVTIDTLRADRLGSYGGDVATPHLDQLAREGVRVTDATVHAPLTRPSHASLLTGLLPFEHGIRDNVSAPLPTDIPTLAERLKQADFRTAAFISSIVLSKQSGLDRGFDTYDDRFPEQGEDILFLNTLQKRADVTIDAATSWLETARREPSRRLGVWVHLYDPHDPYEPPELFRGRYRGRLYDGEVAWTDHNIGRFRASLERLGMLDETLLVVTSDHGESLGEHEESGHGYFVYESTLKVPLIVRGPGIKPGLTVDATVRTIDLLPTLLDLLGIETPPSAPAATTNPTQSLAGRDVARALRGLESLDDTPTYAESLTPLLHYGWSDLRTIRDGRWKYVLAPRPELYDVREDAQEQRNLVTEQASRARALRAALDAQLRAEREATKDRPSASVANVSPELLEKLGALGYVSPGAPPEGSPSMGADPKDNIEAFKELGALMREGLVELREGNYARSVDRLRGLRSRGVDSFEVNFYLGRALANLKRFSEAAECFERAIERLPPYTPAYLSLAETRIAQSRLEDALEVLRRGQAASPTDSRVYDRAGDLLRRMRQPVEAAQAFEAALPLAPQDSLLRVKLGEVYRDLGNTSRSLELLGEAVTLDPSVASYWNSLGMVLGGADQLTDAETAFRRAVDLKPPNAQHVYNLGLVLLRQGKRAEARDMFQHALEVDRRFAPARAQLVQMQAQDTKTGRGGR